ncbi:hypothetical protein [Xanthomonas graminis]|uniref:hypothetical protein n=1 Tax=Xanthomonas graminis TaxID=3390026 RepID=UPI001F3D0AF3|nr:hypothetical protein [Xanthomonas translucens]UKE65178.1 hypothetical protein KM547_16025 [Xanthomonas translucens pv. phlei]
MPQAYADMASPETGSNSPRSDSCGCESNSLSSNIASGSLLFMDSFISSDILSFDSAGYILRNLIFAEISPDAAAAFSHSFCASSGIIDPPSISAQSSTMRFAVAFIALAALPAWAAMAFIPDKNFVDEILTGKHRS